MRKRTAALLAAAATVLGMLATAGPAFAGADPQSQDVPGQLTPEAINTGPCPWTTTTRASGDTQISAAPDSTYATTNGDILAGATFVYGSTRMLAIGGNFSAVINPDGSSHAATNLAFINESTGNFYWGATGVNSYVRAIAIQPGSSNPKVFFGGDFTTALGVAKSRVAAISTLVATPALDSFHAGAPNKVRAIQTRPDGDVFYAGDFNAVYAVDSGSGLIKSHPTTGGSVNALLLSPGTGTGIFVGGLFETVDGYTQHGLQEIYPADTGSSYTAFAPSLRTDAAPGTGDDGEENLTLRWDTNYSPVRLIIGDGGGTVNALHLLNPADGSGYWGPHTEGDLQGIGLVGNTIVGAWHRNHGNDLGCPYYHFGGQFEQGNGAIMTAWDPQLSGDSDPSNVDGGNNGVQEVVSDPVTGQLFMLGAFTKSGSTCGTVDSNYNTCTTGSPRQSLAVFSFS